LLNCQVLGSIDLEAALQQAGQIQALALGDRVQGPDLGLGRGPRSGGWLRRRVTAIGARARRGGRCAIGGLGGAVGMAVTVAVQFLGQRGANDGEDLANAVLAIRWLIRPVNAENGSR